MSWGANEWSAVGGIASAIAAFLSLLVAMTNAKSQKKSYIFERKKELKDNLFNLSRWANENDKHDSNGQWTAESTANITYAIDAAKQRIKDWTSGNEGSEKDYFIDYFRDFLSYRIVQEMYHPQPPDSILKVQNINGNENELYDLWFDNKEFFKMH